MTSRVSFCFFFFLALVSLPVLGQEPIIFKSIAKMTKAASFFGYTSDSKRIYLMGGVSINKQRISYPLVYSFSGGVWATLIFKPPLKIKNYSPTVEFIPELNAIAVIDVQPEIIDAQTLITQPIKVEGGFPISMGSAVWQNQVYLFGGSYGLVDNAAGGFKEVLSDRLFVFDPGAGTISELPPLSSNRVTWGKIVDGKLYTFGGTNGTTSYDDISCYNIQLHSWKFIGLLPHAISNCSIASDGQFIYLMGINNRSGFFGIFNPEDNSYAEHNTNLSFGHGGLIVRENKAFYFGGETLSGYYAMNNHLFEFDLNDLPR